MSNKYQVAHLREQGQNMVIVLMDSSFGRQTSSDQEAQMRSLQACSNSAGLAGTVVPVWLDGRNMGFIAPTPWHPFFKSLSWNTVVANVNKELTCG